MFSLICSCLVRAHARRLGAGGFGRGACLENEFLYAPGFDFAQDQLVGIAAIQHVNYLKSWSQFPGVTKLAEHRSVQLQLVNFSGGVPGTRPVPVRVRVRKERVLMRAA